MASGGNYGGTNLTAEQVQNAQIIAQVGYGMGANQRDVQTALMAAMAESGLRNLHYGDRDSQGLFQQRPSQGWGTVAQVTDPNYAATQFFKHLLAIPNRGSLSPQAAAQSVQRSAFSDGSNYARWSGVAQALASSLPGSGQKNIGGGNLPSDTGNILGDQGQGSGGLGQPNIGGDTGNILNEGQAPDQQGGQSWWQWFENQIPGVSDFHAMAQGLGGIASDLGDVGKAFVWLSSGKHWVRIFAGIAGTVMVFVALSILHNEVKNG